VSIEQQILDALADIRLELFRGNKNPKMIDEIAIEYGLKPEVLAVPLAKAYGSLADLETRHTKSLATAAIEARMKRAIFDYAQTEGGINIAVWLAERAGRAPSFEEVQFADELWMQHVLNKLMASN